jgi:deoxyribodipyrimidine photolyase
MRLIAQHNTCFIPQFAKNVKEIIYAPIYKSKVQKDFFTKRYNELKKQFHSIKFVEQLELKEKDIVIAWDAIYEQDAFGKHLAPNQNRLFTKLDFTFKDSFTSFRNNAEKFLPDIFADTVSPVDQEAIDCINFYFENNFASQYFETRNQMLGDNFSTKFSCYLSSGALDPKLIYNKVKEYEKKHGANKSTYWIIFELLWREFFYWHYQKYPKQYFSLNGIKGPLHYPEIYEYSIDELRAMTSKPFFIAALNELEQTGFQSNRTRQMFASVWINDLKLSWLEGAKLFENYLIDYDVYSNYGNWMYLAGVGVDPRGKRYFNIEKQLELYNSDGSYIRKWY